MGSRPRRGRSFLPARASPRRGRAPYAKSTGVSAASFAALLGRRQFVDDLSLLDHRQRIIHVLREDDRLAIDGFHGTVEQFIPRAHLIGLVVWPLEQREEPVAILEDAFERDFGDQHPRQAGDAWPAFRIGPAAE